MENINLTYQQNHETNVLKTNHFHDENISFIPCLVCQKE